MSEESKESKAETTPEVSTSESTPNDVTKRDNDISNTLDNLSNKIIELIK